MNTALISTRYAMALLMYAESLNRHEKVYEEMKMLIKMFTEVKAFGRALNKPSIDNEQKIKLIETAAGGDVSRVTKRFIQLLFTNKRVGFLRSIAYRYQELYCEKYDRLHGRLITATRVDKETYLRLKAFAQQRKGVKVDLERVVDPAILGGFIIQIEDDLIDASVVGELQQIERNLIRLNNQKVV